MIEEKKRNIRKNNICLYPIYIMFRIAILFFYTISVLWTKTRTI